MSLPHDELSVLIQNERHIRGRLLGELIDKYGAEAVVKALGSEYIAYSLGVYQAVTETEPEEE